ncbi:MAG: hypothetical protein AAFQ90_01175 [Pseudomonadota bacterium]
MIEADASRPLSDLLRRLRDKGGRIAEKRARLLASRNRNRNRGHSWRDAQGLWPEIFEDR